MIWCFWIPRIDTGKAKLFPRRVGPFRIVAQISESAFRLDLPKSWRVHPVFHVSLLARYFEDKGTDVGVPDLNLLPKHDPEPIPWKILNRRVDSNGKEEYLIQYSNASLGDAVWESPLVLLNHPKVLKDFLGEDGV
jgi:hypothetical protein